MMSNTDAKWETELDTPWHNTQKNNKERGNMEAIQMETSQDKKHYSAKTNNTSTEAEQTTMANVENQEIQQTKKQKLSSR